MKPTADKFCRCIKKVGKTLKARKGSTPEQGAIAVCVKSVLQTRGRTMKKFRCGKKGYLKTQKMRRGGVHGVFGWASINGMLGEMTAAIARAPGKKDVYVREAHTRLTTHGDVPAVDDKTRKSYEDALKKAAPYPELHDLLKSMETGSSWARRGPMATLRSVRREQGMPVR